MRFGTLWRPALVAFAVVSALAFGAISPVAAYGDNRGAVPYFGGPVMHQETTYALFWDPGGALSSTTKNLLTRYLADVAHDSGRSTNVFSVLAQYTDATGNAAYDQTFGGALSDTDSYPSKSSKCQLLDITWPPGTPCIVDSQIQTELSSYIALHSLPTGMSARSTPSSLRATSRSATTPREGARRRLSAAITATSARARAG